MRNAFSRDITAVLAKPVSKTACGQFIALKTHMIRDKRHRFCSSVRNGIDAGINVHDDLWSFLVGRFFRWRKIFVIRNVPLDGATLIIILQTRSGSDRGASFFKIAGVFGAITELLQPIDQFVDFGTRLGDHAIVNQR